MKNSYLIILIFTLITYGTVKILAREQIIEKARKVVKQCKRETNATSDEVWGLVKFLPPRTRAAKCLHACIKREFGVTDARGRLIKSEMMKIASRAARNDPENVRKSEEIVDFCGRVLVPHDHCEAAAVYFHCFRRLANAKNIEFVFLDIGLTEF